MKPKDSPKELRRVLVANRGEIAVRIIRAARQLGIESVAVYTPADEGSQHVRLADRAVSLGASAVSESYLNQEKLIQAAIQSGADSLHPGYGFFAENAAFAEAVCAEGLVWIGPKPEVMSLMANKQKAREAAKAAKVPVVPGGPVNGSLKDLAKAVKKIGYPLMLKATAGGSGRGMRIVESEEELEERLEEAKKEAASAFGDDEMLFEKCVLKARHIEVQVFGDSQGNVVHLGERDCSVQRRHQKLIEEAPAAGLAKGLRKRLCEAAVSLARKVNYEGAGTVEFLVEGGGKDSDPFYFLEMNTRIQVEHPVTEEVYGVDLVAEQFLVASGLPLSFMQKSLKPIGHAIEFRVYAEDPSRGFVPSSGEILYIARAGGPGLREDGWVEAGTVLSAYYDSLLSKVIVSGRSREEALKRSEQVLSEYEIEGIPNTLGFHRWILQTESFRNAAVDVKWIDREYSGEILAASSTGPLILPTPKDHSVEPQA